MVGTHLDDTLDGQAGNDTLQGADGDDTLIGGPGADNLLGGVGNDTYVVDSTADVLAEAAAEGIDTVQSPITWTLGSNFENLVLTGSAGVNATGNTLANVLTGNAGANNLSGGAGDDTLDGSGGNDTLNGGTGNNLYKFGRGGGQDFIKDVLDSTANKASTLLFGADVAPSDVSIRQVYTAYWGWSADLEFSIKGTTDKISVSGMWRGAGGFGGEYTPVQVVKFGDGTTWSSATLIPMVLTTTPGDDNITGSAYADVLEGGLGNDTLNGSNGNDRLSGEPGNDTLTGGTGNNAYVFNRGDGQDLIANFKDTTLGKASVLEFGPGIAPADVAARQVYDSFFGTSAAIEFSITGTTDKVTVGGMWRTAGGNGDEYGVVQLVKFADGTTWNYATFVPALMATTAGNDLITGTINADNIDGGAGDDNLNGGKGNDTLIGGPGNDTLAGETGNNTYVFNRGDGQDLITNFTDTTVGKNSVLQFGANIAPGDVLARQVYDSTFGMNAAIEFSIVGTADKVTVGGMWRAAGGFGNQLGVVQSVRFADGTAWNYSTFVPTLMAGTSGNDTIVGTVNADNIHGGDGNDAIAGMTGNDTITGGAGDDSLYGDLGNDTLDGGAGNDSLAGGTGNNTYLFGRGDGQDVITYLSDSTALKTNTLRFKEGVLSTDVLLSQTYENSNLFYDFYNLRLSIAGSSDAITIVGYWKEFDTPGNRTTSTVQRIEFADGTVWGLADVKTRYFNGTPAHDGIFGTNGNDTIITGAGDDTLIGRGGNDLLIGGDGYDTVWEPFVGTYAITRIGDNTYTVSLNGETDTLQGIEQLNQTVKFLWGYSMWREWALTTGGVVVDDATPEIGQTLSMISTLGNNAITVTARRWQVQVGGTWSDIPGATSSTFTPGVAQAGMSLRALLTFSDRYGSGQVATSPPTAALPQSSTLLTRNDGIGGTSVEDQILSAATTSSAAADGLDPPSFQWSMDGAAASAAPSTTYEMGASGDALAIQLRNAYVDGGGAAALLTSAVNGLASNANDEPQGLPLITGTAEEDSVLTVDAALVTDEGGLGAFSVSFPPAGSAAAVANADGLGPYNYQWQRNGVDIAGATEVTYALGDADAGKQIRVRVSYADGWGAHELLTSATTAVVANVNDAPVGLPSISGTAAVGQSLSAVTTAISDADGLGALAFQRTRGGVTVAGATAANYVLTNADAGAQIAVGVAYIDGFGTLGVLASTPTGVVQFLNHPPTGSVAIGGNAALGQTLTATSSVADVDGLGALTWRWQALDGTVWSDVADNNRSTLIVDARFAGMPLRAGVSYTDGRGAAEAAFATATSAVPAVTFNAINGTAGAETLTGTAGADKLSGRAGDDTLNGRLGTDLMLGGLGDDIYVVDSLADGVIESAGEGNVTVQSLVPYTLPAAVENIALTGTAANNATGNSQDNQLTGNSAANLLQDEAGNDTLNGGAGADTLAGGTGNDTYVVDNMADAVDENAGEGTDLVQASVTFTLGNNFENLSLAGTATINGTGNLLNNNLLGNSGNNVLTGGAGNDMLDGAAGNDTLVGGAGDDIYFVDVTKDVVTELANEGTDTVNAAVTFNLPANVENLNLTGSLGNNGTGYTLSNIIVGNAAANTLTGDTGNDTLDGGAGADKLVGGIGNDTYIVDLATDITTEGTNEGTDTVLASVTLTLSSNIENLTLTGRLALNGNGNTLANVLLGNSAANVLTGAAGSDTLDGAAGNDTLMGGTGADIYLFGRGSGVDMLQENDATAGVMDRVQFGANIVQADTAFTRTGNDLTASVGATVDKLMLKDWCLGTAYQVEQFAYANGTVLSNTQVANLVAAMAAFDEPAAAASSSMVRTTQFHATDLAASGAMT